MHPERESGRRVEVPRQRLASDEPDRVGQGKRLLDHGIDGV
jgi:hypothetical protein